MEKNEKCFDLEKEYSSLRKKYKLPEFNSLLEDFDIEKLNEKETRFLLREIRRAINDKLSAYVHLLEMLLNPNSPPMFIFPLIRSLDETHKELIKEAYKSLSKLQIELMRLDTIYSEEAEALFIENSYNLWQNTKPKILEIVAQFEKSSKQENSDKRINYFN